MDQGVVNEILNILATSHELKGPSSDGNYSCRCPFHEPDHHSKGLSFSFNPDKGVFLCFSCGKRGTARALAEEVGVKVGPLGLEELAIAKGIPLQWLKENKLARQGTRGVQIPYRNEADQELSIRQRINLGNAGYGGRFRWRPGDKPMLYGLEGLAAIRQRGYAYLTEGETDKWTLQLNEMPVLGIPGAQSWKSKWAKDLDGIQIYLCMDSDKPGQGLLQKVAPDVPGLRVIKIPDGHKDINELYLSDPEQFTTTMESLKTNAPLAEEVIAELGLDQAPPGDKYVTKDDHGRPKVAIHVLLQDLMTDFAFRTMRDTEELLFYRNGVYRENGEVFVKEQVERRVPITGLVTTHLVNEVVNHIRRKTYVDREDFNSTPFVLNLANGLFDIRTMQLQPHSPDFLSTIRIPVAYDPGAKCPLVAKFMSEVVRNEDIKLLQELFGYCLYSEYQIQKAFILNGQGENGKSTALGLLQSFVGIQNCSNVSLQSLTQKPFYRAQLYGKLANVFADLPSTALHDTGWFKMLTGGDMITAEHKFRPPFSFKNNAKLVFSANQPPQVEDDSYAFWRRWILIDLPNEFPPGQRDSHIIHKLTTPQELSGLLNVALQGLQRVLANDDFSYKYTVDEVAEMYQKAADPVYAFLKDNCEAAADGWITKDDLYGAFLAYCTESRIPALKPNAFGRAMQNQKVIIVSTTKVTRDDKRINAWQGIRIIDVKDVKDVNDFPCFKRYMEEGNTLYTQGSINYVKNVDNPDNLDRVDDEPSTPCFACGSSNYWQKPDGEWVCGTCHPQPK